MTRRCGLPTGRRHVLSAFVLALMTAALLGAAAPAQGSMSLGTTTTLTRDVVHYLSAATLLGPVPASQQVAVGVVLNNPNQAAEDSYSRSCTTPRAACTSSSSTLTRSTSSSACPRRPCRPRKAGSPDRACR